MKINNFFIIFRYLVIVFILVLTIFLTRNANRIIKENSIYEKLSLYSVNYLMDESYFRIDKQFKSLEKNYFECKNTGIKCKSPIKKESQNFLELNFLLFEKTIVSILYFFAA